MFKDKVWRLPRGFIRRKVGIGQVAHRILGERTVIKYIYLIQYQVFYYRKKSILDFSKRIINMYNAICLRIQSMKKDLLGYNRVWFQ